ncbi:MAG: 3-hydroxyacyl-CoA dehydrogenase family protein [Quisquiliibacterium sp.]
MLRYVIEKHGESRSFPGEEPQTHPLLVNAADHPETHGPRDVLVLIGPAAGQALAGVGNRAAWRAILVELGTECLGVHTGEERGTEGSNVLGFARFRMGSALPSALVELVRQPGTHPDAISAAREVFEGNGLKVAICNDFPGRIVDRLIRPYLNAALRRLDEKLASADDMDTTLRLGLGYPEGPISLLERTGLAEHHDVTLALQLALGDSAYAPARRAQVAKARQSRG